METVGHRSNAAYPGTWKDKNGIRFKIVTNILYWVGNTLTYYLVIYSFDISIASYIFQSLHADSMTRNLLCITSD